MSRKCQDCGAYLSAYNPGELCFPCQKKRQEQLREKLSDTPHYTADDMRFLLGLENVESVKRLGRKGIIPGRVPGIRKHLYQKEIVDKWIKDGGRPLDDRRERPESPPATVVTVVSDQAIDRAIVRADKRKTHHADLIEVAEQWRERLLFPKPARLRPHDPSGHLMIEFTCANGRPFDRCYPDMVMHGKLGLEDEELFPFLKDHLKGDDILRHYDSWHEKTSELKERCCQLFTRVEKDVRAMVEESMGDSWADLKGDSSTDLPWALAEWAYDTITVVPPGGVLAGPCSEPWPLNVVKYSEDCPEWSSVCRGSLRLATLPSDSAATLMAAYESLVGRFKGYPEVEEIRKLVDEIGVLYLKLYDEFSFLINSRQVPGRCAYCSSPDRS